MAFETFMNNKINVFKQLDTEILYFMSWITTVIIDRLKKPHTKPELAIFIK